MRHPFHGVTSGQILQSDEEELSRQLVGVGVKVEQITVCEVKTRLVCLKPHIVEVVALGDVHTVPAKQPVKAPRGKAKKDESDSDVDYLEDARGADSDSEVDYLVPDPGCTGIDHEDSSLFEIWVCALLHYQQR